MVQLEGLSTMVKRLLCQTSIARAVFDQENFNMGVVFCEWLHSGGRGMNVLARIDTSRRGLDYPNRTRDTSYPSLCMIEM